MKIKNVIISVFVLLFLGLSTFFLFNKIQQTQQKKDSYHRIPNFQLPDITGNSITDAFLQKHKAVMFLFFNPDCNSCIEELIQIKDNQTSLSKGQMVFVSTLPVDTIQHFLQKMDFVPAKNMLFLSDEKAMLNNKMEVRTSPTVYIYKKGLLTKRFEGQVKIETIISYLSEE